MDIETAQQIIAAVCHQHATFRPLSAPTPTVGGWRVTFEQVSVSMDTVAKWFGSAGAVATMVGIENVYADVPTMIAEFRR